MGFAEILNLEKKSIALPLIINYFLYIGSHEEDYFQTSEKNKISWILSYLHTCKWDSGKINVICIQLIKFKVAMVLWSLNYVYHSFQKLIDASFNLYRIFAYK